MVWILLASMILAVLLYIAAPLYQRGPVQVQAKSAAPEYLAQIEALERRIAGGESGLTGRKTELERRAIAAGEGGFKGDDGPSRLALALVFAAVTLGATGLYLGLGRPDLSGPQSALMAQIDNEAPQSKSLEDLSAQLKARLDRNPDQPEGWLLYARSLMQLARFDDAINAYERAVRLNETSLNIADELAQARAFIAAQSNPSLNIAGPSRADIDAASQMDEESRQMMIEGMVTGLAARLYAAEDVDAGSWVRLLRARQVLGQSEQALADIEHLKTRLADQPKALEDILQQAGRTP